MTKVIPFVSPEDADLIVGAKVDSRGQVFHGVHEHRRRLATIVAERKLGRGLRENERVGFRDRNQRNLIRENVVVVSVEARTRYNRKKPGCTSRFKGVSWQSSRQKWYAQIKIDQKTKNLGRYDSEERAARVYDEAVRSLGIDIAFTNFREIPENSPDSS